MICRVCKSAKTIEEFPWVRVGVNRSTRCKVCQRVLSKKHYNANPSLYQAKNRKRNLITRAQNLPKIYDYLLTHPCVKCGEYEPLFLDFDHIDPSTKMYNIAHMMTRRYGWEKILKEIDKCQILCVKCHRLKTAKENNWYQYQRYSKMMDSQSLQKVEMTDEQILENARKYVRKSEEIMNQKFSEYEFESLVNKAAKPIFQYWKWKRKQDGG